MEIIKIDDTISLIRIALREIDAARIANKVLTERIGVHPLAKVTDPYNKPLQEEDAELASGHLCGDKLFLNVYVVYSAGIVPSAYSEIALSECSGLHKLNDYLTVKIQIAAGAVASYIEENGRRLQEELES